MTASDPITSQKTSRGKKAEKPEHMDLSILDENAPSMIDDLLNNDLCWCFFVSYNSVKTIYSLIIHLFIHWYWSYS